MSTQAVHTVVIVDDHGLLRAGTRQILEEAGGFQVVGEAADGEAGLALVAELDPELVLVDIRLPGLNGIEVARRIAAGDAGTRVVVVSAYDDEDYVQAALAAGVAGYLLKTTPGDELVGALRAALSGVTVLDPAITSHLAAARAARARAHDGLEGRPDVSPSLTAREAEVVHLVVEGLANKAIAHRLGISVRTVEGHLNHIFDKTGASSRTELFRLALERGLVPRREQRPGSGAGDTAAQPHGTEAAAG
ncbi:MAG: response regulator transcription factor [Actinomycetota bacterium]|nr:response regulator transcription factor [Actinomycetota bacterium]